MESIDQYTKEINRYSLLSKKEEIALAHKIQSGDLAARQQMVDSNLRFVVKIAYGYIKYGVPLPDLIQEGNIGLIKAAKKFDPDRGYRFISYAVYWIKAYIHNRLVDSYSLVKMGTTQYQRTLFFKMRSTRNEMTVDGKEPTDIELAERLSVRKRDVEEMSLRMASRDFSVDSEIHGDTKQTHLEMMIDDSDSQDEEYFKTEKAIQVRTEVCKISRSLNTRERYIIKHRLMSDEPKTFREIGGKFLISRERVRQIEGNVIKKLRMVFEATELRPMA